MRVKKLKNLQNSMGLKGCKWSSLNAPGTETHLFCPILELGNPLLSTFVTAISKSIAVEGEFEKRMQRKEDGGQNSKGKRSGFDKCNQGGRDVLGWAWKSLCGC